MISKTMEVLAKSIGLKQSENSIYGIYGDFFMTITETRAKKTVEISCFIGNNEDYADDYLSINDGIRDVLDKYNISDYGVKPDGVFVTGNGTLAVYREMLDYVIGLLNDTQIPNSHYCAKCGEQFKEGEKRRVVTLSTSKEEHKHLLCEHCALAAAEPEQSEDDEKENTQQTTAKYGKGILSSLLVGFTASCVYIVLFWLSGTNGRADLIRFLPCLLGFAIGGAVFVVYRSTSGRIDKIGVMISSIVSALLTMFAHFFGCVLGFGKYVSNKFSVPFSPFSSSLRHYIGIQFSDEKSLRFVVVGMIIAICAAFIAIVVFYGNQDSKNNKNEKVKVTIQTVK